MRAFMGLMIVMAGVFLMIYGLNASDSFYSQVSRLFSGATTDASIWLMVGGVFAVILGLAVASTRGHHHHRTQQICGTGYLDDLLGKLAYL